jgi:hypothetical protein
MKKLLFGAEAAAMFVAIGPAFASPQREAAEDYPGWLAAERASQRTETHGHIIYRWTSTDRIKSAGEARRRDSRQWEWAAKSSRSRAARPLEAGPWCVQYHAGGASCGFPAFQGCM